VGGRITGVDGLGPDIVGEVGACEADEGAGNFSVTAPVIIAGPARSSRDAPD
jgi:hypothetical protein